MGSYRKGLLLSLGPLRAAVDLNTVAPEKRSGLKRLCPTHYIPLHQRYECSEGPHLVDEWVNGMEQADGGWKVVDPEEKPSVDAVRVLELTPVPTAELEANTFEGRSTYYCEPSSIGDHLNWELFRRALKGKMSFVARGAMRRGGEKLWRLELFRNYLVLREIMFPETIKPAPEAPDVRVDKETSLLVKKFIDTKSTEWENFDSEDTLQHKVDEWLSAGTEKESKETGGATPPKDAVQSLQDALRAAVGG